MHTCSPLVLSGLRKQDGEAVASLILVSTHEEEKQKHHSLEESYVITKEFFLVERVERDKLESRSGGQDDERTQSKSSRIIDQRKQKRNRGGKM